MPQRSPTDEDNLAMLHAIAKICGDEINGNPDPSHYCCRLKSLKIEGADLDLENGVVGFRFYSNVELGTKDSRFRIKGPWLRNLLRKNGFGEQLIQDHLGTNRNTEGRCAFVGLRLNPRAYGNWSNDDKVRLQELYTSLLKFQHDVYPHDANTRSQLIKAYNEANLNEVDEDLSRHDGGESDSLSTTRQASQIGGKSMTEEIKIKEEIKDLLESNLQVILTGAPGTGKTYTAKEVAKAMTDDTEDTPKEALHIASVQFHPGYDYSDFVIGMKPVLVDEGGNEIKPGECGSGKLQVSYRWKDGVFKEFADKARKAFDESEDKGNAPKFVFLIDEINRADLSRVFGELFSLLEEEYRYPNNDKGVILPNGKDFVIPKNLYIIGTMNDIDRSVESMDFALRRRFAWYEVTASSSKGIIDTKGLSLGDCEKLKRAMEALNREIGGEEGVTLDLRLGSEYQLGGAIFAKFEKCGGNFHTLWDRFIRTTLNEYLRGRKDKNHLLEQLKEVFDNAVKDTPRQADA